MNKKRIVITGGSGLLALNWACAIRDQWDVVLGTHLHSVELAGVSTLMINLDNPEILREQLESLAPDLIVHTAGLTNVDKCEDSPEHAHHANAIIARNVSEISASMNVKLVHISTDHLFSGEHDLYSETSTPEPLNEYARSKLLAEKWVLSSNPEAIIVRTNFFGWGPSSRQSFSDWIIYNLRSGNNLSLFDDVYFTPILVDRLAVSVHSLVEKEVSGIYNIVGDDRITKFEFAQKLCEYFSLPTELIRRDKISAANLQAQRPKDMSLSNAKAKLILGNSFGLVGDYFSELHSQEIDGRKSELFSAVT